MKLLILILFLVCLPFTIGYSNPDKQIHCLAEAIYFESRGEPFIGMVAVGQVIIQRVKSDLYPNNICDVVHQGKTTSKGYPVKNKCEFSYWCDGKPEIMEDEFAYTESLQAADLILNDIIIEGLEDALHYHAAYVHPRWAKDYIKLKTIGLHIFYARPNY